VPPGYDFTLAVGFQIVSSDACLDTETEKETACHRIERQVASDIDVEEVRVHCFATCGSLIFDVYVEGMDNEAALTSAIDAAYPDAAALETAFGVTVVRQTMAYVASLPLAGPPAFPPPPPPMCAAICDELLEGANLSTDRYAFMCTKREPNRGMTCRPMYNPRGCPSDHQACYMSHTPTGSVAGRCQDSPGKWASKKCAKKARKNKCRKRKVKRNCPATCGQC
jgi:hypothetical protein